MKSVDWEKELQQILLEWESGKDNPMMGAMRVGSRTLTLSRFIRKLLSKQKKAILEEVEDFLSYSTQATDEFGDVTVIFNKKRWAELRNKLQVSKIIEE